MLPSTAAPKGAPTFFSACRTPEPTPALSAVSSDRAAEAVVAMVMPTPTPASAIQPATKPPCEARLVCAPSTARRPARRNPHAAVSFAPTLRAMRSAGSGADQQTADQRQQPQAGALRVHPEDRLEVLGHGEHDADHGERHDGHEDDAPGKRG